MNGYVDLRREALTSLALGLALEGFLANVKGHYAARLTVTRPGGASGWVICERGYGDVEWFWWLDGTPIAPAAESDVAVEEIKQVLASRGQSSHTEVVEM